MTDFRPLSRATARRAVALLVAFSPLLTLSAGCGGSGETTMTTPAPAPMPAPMATPLPTTRVPGGVDTLAVTGTAVQDARGLTVTPRTIPGVTASTLVYDYEGEKDRIGQLRVSPVNAEGDPITGLDSTNFRLDRGPRRADILSVTPLSQTEATPMRVVIAIDNSSSIEPYVGAIKRDIEKFMASFSPVAQVGIVFFSEDKNPAYLYHNEGLNVKAQPFADRNAAIKYALGEYGFVGRTFLYDEVYAAAQMFERTPSRIERNYLIILSDGLDLNSRTKKQDVADLITQTGVRPFAIDYLVEKRQSNSDLETLAKINDGLYFRAENADAVSAAFNRIAEELVDKGYRIRYRFKAPPAPVVSASAPSVTFTETLVRESFPLLNYVFFGVDSSNIADRYHRFNTTGEASGFDETKIGGGALDQYDYLLDIVGTRLRANPAAALTITGNNMNTGPERNDKALSDARAATVRDYLVNTWGIDAARLTLASRTLPAVPSVTNTPEGQAENRRVELTSDAWEILRPVTFVRRTRRAQPDALTFNLQPIAAEGLKSWTLTVQQGNQTVLRQTGTTAPTAPIRFAYLDSRNQLPTSEAPYMYTLSATDAVGETVTTQPQQIAVKQVTVEQQLASSTGARSYEKISLVLFEFNKSTVDPRNDRILREFVYPRIDGTSRVDIVGHTDLIGSDAYNLTLSDKRAATVYAQVQPNVQADTLGHRGVGEADPIFDNGLPEGRFYNRTVVVNIDKQLRSLDEMDQRSGSAAPAPMPTPAGTDPNATGGN